MKKKTFLIFSALVFSMFFVGSTAMAVPYSLMFDADAGGGGSLINKFGVGIWKLLLQKAFRLQIT